MEILVNWKCPTCGCDNCDDYKDTVRPLCEVCADDFDWIQVASYKDRSTANRTLLAMTVQNIREGNEAG